MRKYCEAWKSWLTPDLWINFFWLTINKMLKTISLRHVLKSWWIKSQHCVEPIYAALTVRRFKRMKVFHSSQRMLSFSWMKLSVNCATVSQREQKARPRNLSGSVDFCRQITLIFQIKTVTQHRDCMQIQVQVWHEGGSGRLRRREENVKRDWKKTKASHTYTVTTGNEPWKV